MKDFRDLKVWDRAHQLTLRIYKVSSRFPREELFGLISQMRRCSASIGANIAEGCKKRGNNEFQRFLQIASGSASELEDHLSEEEAQRAAIGEAVERYCAAHWDARCATVAKWDQVSSAAISPDDFVLYSQAQYETPGWPNPRWNLHIRTEATAPEDFEGISYR